MKDESVRDTHSELDGQMVYVTEEFTSNGNTATCPGNFGVAEEDINCRCFLEYHLMTAKEFLAAGGTLPNGLIFDEESGKIISEVEKLSKEAMLEPQSNPFKEMLKEAHYENITYNKVHKFQEQPTEQEIISRLGGMDRTNGSCSSLAMAYLANKHGLDVIDYRGGASRTFFSQHYNDIAALVPGSIHETCNILDDAWDLLGTMSDGKEYYFKAGEHAACVRRSENGYQYLELQGSADFNGWKSLTKDELENRFKTNYPQDILALVDGDDLMEVKKIRTIFGYMNTAENEQQKGDGGSVK